MMQGVTSILVRRLVRGAPANSCFRNFSDFSASADSKTLERSLNRIQLLGRVGDDPHKRGTDENPVVIFSLATNTAYKTKDGEGMQQATDWHRVCVFKPRLKETVYNFLKKGSRVYVSGSIKYGQIPDAHGTGKVTVTSIIADDVIFIS